MKKLSTLTFGLLLGIMSYAQNGTKIPFQGNLTENGTPINGDRKIEFSIDDVNWSESYTAVSITNGFYTVILGSSTPLPMDLFDGVESRLLNISVEDTDLGSLEIFAPFTTQAALSPDSVVLRNMDGDLKLDLSIFEANDAGSLVLYGNDNERAVILGTSGARSGKTGFLGLYDSIGNQKVSLRVDELNGDISGGVLSIRNNVLNSSNFYNETVKIANINDAGWLALRDANSQQNISLYGENGNGDFSGDLTIGGDLLVSGEIISSMEPLDSLFKTIDDGVGTGIGFTSAIDGAGRELNWGMYGLAKTEKFNVGVQGDSESSATNVSRNTGVYGRATGDGSGDHRGVVGYAASSAAKYNKGTYGIAEGAGNGDTGKNFGEGSINFGVEGNAGGNAWNNTGVEGSNFGEAGEWNFGLHGISNAGTGTTVENHGVAGRAYGTGINYGVYGEANGGEENWAGYFSGNVNTNGNQTIDGTISATGDISGDGDLTILGNLVIGGEITSSLKPLDSLSKTVSDETGTAIGFTSALDGAGRELNWGVYGLAKTEKFNVGVQGDSESSATNVSRNTGVYGRATGDGSADHRGVVGYATSSGAKYNKGIYGIAEGAGNGDTGKNFGEGSINFGIEGNAGGNAWNNTGVEGSNYGTSGEWNFGLHGISNAGTGTTVENHGVAGRAFGSGINYGVYGEAGGGAEDWAGYFAGNVNTNGNLNVNGDISATGDISGATVTPSDRRLKKEIEVLDGALEMTRKLKGVRYTWNDKAQGNRPGTRDVGVIAQDVEAVVPELVKETPDGYKAVNYSQLVAVLIEAVKELDREVTTLQVENKKLKSQLSKKGGKDIQQLKSQIAEIQLLLNMSKTPAPAVTSTSK